MNTVNEPTDLVAGRRPPTVFCERIRHPDGDLFRFFCVDCNRYHTHGAEPGHARPHCFTADSRYAETGYLLSEAEESPMPAKRYRPRYTRHGDILSGRPRGRR